MKNLFDQHNALVQHPCYGQLTELENLKLFMQTHVFAVWDFMSLLKSLQRKLTCIDLPWRPTPYPEKIARLINEIVLGEESDLDWNGEAKSHFNMYLDAMKEVGADDSLLQNWLSNNDASQLPLEVWNFVSYHLDLAQNGKVEEVAGAFFWGREKLLPDVFTSIVNVIENSSLNCPALVYYFQRHIELDGDHHGPMSLECLEILCGNNIEMRERAMAAASKSLRLRYLLWDGLLARMSKDSLLALNP
ncbi:MAG: hypothetical protein COW00_14205 [Bdellovibrio sp. CG12_big_fil_rev_8_21_14_0_65_39_13]|nr:MAG: hypothetical protein COW00_14205 [Bdellovibrio sp. CG12_big_fil_rev_8_21_14_0_65_39_13]